MRHSHLNLNHLPTKLGIKLTERFFFSSFEISTMKILLLRFLFIIHWGKICFQDSPDWTLNASHGWDKRNLFFVLCKRFFQGNKNLPVLSIWGPVEDWIRGSKLFPANGRMDGWMQIAAEIATNFVHYLLWFCCSSWKCTASLWCPRKAHKGLEVAVVWAANCTKGRSRRAAAGNWINSVSELNYSITAER